MNLEPFETLCRRVCELSGALAGELSCDDQGFITFDIGMQGARATVLLAPESESDNLFTLVDFGPTPAADARERWHTFVDANLQLMGQPHAPVFCVDPTSQRVVLRRCYRLGQVSAEELSADLSSAFQGALPLPAGFGAGHPAAANFIEERRAHPPRTVG